VAYAGAAADGRAAASGWAVIDVAGASVSASEPAISTARTVIAAVTVDLAESASGAAIVAVT
jgi:hypothetical protein